MLNLDELLRRIPGLIARLTPFTVFSVYALTSAGRTYGSHAEGYPL